MVPVMAIGTSINGLQFTDNINYWQDKLRYFDICVDTYNDIFFPFTK